MPRVAPQPIKPWLGPGWKVQYRAVNENAIAVHSPGAIGRRERAERFTHEAMGMRECEQYLVVQIWMAFDLCAKMQCNTCRQRIHSDKI